MPGGAGRTVYFVRDNGMGIEKQFHDRIFGLFDKLDPATDGTGIGLALVKQIIEQHGGKIWVESEGQRKEPTFCFTLPADAKSFRRGAFADQRNSPTPNLILLDLRLPKSTGIEVLKEIKFSEQHRNIPWSC